MNNHLVFKYDDLIWHIITIFLCLFLVCVALLTLWIAYNKKRMSLCYTLKIFDLFICLIISLILFRTFVLPIAFTIWSIFYFLVGFFETNNRKIRYINIVVKNDNTYKKVYKYINSANRSEKFFNNIKHNFTDIAKVFGALTVNKKDTAWKKAFFPFCYFVSGLIVPSLNLLIYGFQFSNGEWLLFKLLEINILILTILWYLYPITNYLAVEIETGVMFQSKFWFNLSFALFSFAVIVLLNGILIVTN